MPCTATSVNINPSTFKHVYQELVIAVYHATVNTPEAKNHGGRYNCNYHPLYLMARDLRDKAWAA